MQKKINYFAMNIRNHNFYRFTSKGNNSYSEREYESERELPNTENIANPAKTPVNPSNITIKTLVLNSKTIDLKQNLFILIDVFYILLPLMVVVEFVVSSLERSKTKE
jgi:hypothetical protein